MSRNFDVFDELAELMRNKNRQKTSKDRLTNDSGLSDKSTKNNKKVINASTVPAIDAVVLFALKDPEMDMFLKACGVSPVDDIRNGIVYKMVNMETDGSPIRLVLAAQREMGLVSSSILATISLLTYKPKLLVMGGICAGVEGRTAIGDLIVADPVFNYEAGKRTSNGFKANYIQRPLTRRCKEVAEQIKDDRVFLRTIKDSWDLETGKPQTEINVHIAPMASGSSVLTEPKVIEDVANHHRTITGIDMEAFSIGQSAYEVLREEVPWLVVKGVQDYANEDKNDKSREYAAYMSAKFLIEFIRKYFATDE